MIVTRIRRRVCLLLGAIFLLVGLTSNGQVFAGSTDSASQNNATTLKVLAVGGSSAHGWADPHHLSYLLRAFTSFAVWSDFKLAYDDKTIPGAPAVSVPSTKFAEWLGADHPQVVILSWGILDDVHNQTSLPAFSATIRDEIAQALAVHAVVLVVTPPVVEASFQTLRAQYDVYAAAEFTTVQSIHNPNVYWYDLHQQTLRYVEAHGSNVQQYCANGWHPNTRGQALGGRLLLDDVQDTFGHKSRTFHHH